MVSDACPTFTPANCGLSLVQSPMRAGIAVTLSSSTAPVPAVLLPRIRLVFMSTSPASGKSTQFVSVPDEGVPIAGVTRVGEVANTRDQEPVSSLITHFNSSEVVAANCASVHDVSASHPPAGLDHFSPVASAESAVRTCQLVPTASREAVLAPVHQARSHLASQIASVSTDPPPDITISPLPKIEVELIVLMFVQDTRVSCFPASHIVYVEFSTLSVLRLSKFVFTCHLKDAPVIQSFNVVIVLIYFIIRSFYRKF